MRSFVSLLSIAAALPALVGAHNANSRSRAHMRAAVHARQESVSSSTSTPTVDVSASVSASVSVSVGTAEPTATGEVEMVAAAWYAGYHATEFPVANIPWEKYTHVTYAFGIPSEDAANITLSAEDQTTLKEFVDAAHQNDCKASLSLGGWGGSVFFSSSVGDETNRTAFVNAITDIVEQYELDGIDFDWEYPNKQGIGCNTISPDDSANFLSTIQALRATDTGSSLVLSAAVSINPFMDSTGSPSSDVSEFAKVLDYIAIMNYDIWGAWASAVGPNAPLNDTCAPTEDQQGSAVSAVDAWTSAGMPASQIVLGVAAYGHSFSVSSSDAFVDGSDSELAAYPAFDANTFPQGDSWDVGAGTQDVCGVTQNAAGSQNMWALVESGLLSATGEPAEGVPHRFDNCSQTDYIYNAESSVMISYDSPQAFTAKGQFIDEMGLRGFAMWEMGGDSDNVWVDAVRAGAGIEDDESCDDEESTGTGSDNSGNTSGNGGASSGDVADSGNNLVNTGGSKTTESSTGGAGDEEEDCEDDDDESGVPSDVNNSNNAVDTGDDEDDLEDCDEDGEDGADDEDDTPSVGSGSGSGSGNGNGNIAVPTSISSSTPATPTTGTPTTGETGEDDGEDDFDDCSDEGDDEEETGESSTVVDSSTSEAGATSTASSTSSAETSVITDVGGSKNGEGNGEQDGEGEDCITTTDESGATVTITSGAVTTASETGSASSSASETVTLTDSSSSSTDSAIATATTNSSSSASATGTSTVVTESTASATESGANSESTLCETDTASSSSAVETATGYSSAVESATSPAVETPSSAVESSSSSVVETTSSTSAAETVETASEYSSSEESSSAAETPVVETPAAAETPVVETPVVETPVSESATGYEAEPTTY